MRKISLIMTLIFALILGACSKEGVGEENSQKTTDDKIVIGFSVGTTKEERWQTDIDLAQKYADENDLGLIVQSADEDASKQIQQVENMLTKGIDVLIISAQDSESAGAVIELAHEAGVKVISYDRLARNGELDYFVTFDTPKVGELQAKSLVETYPTGNYLWLLGGPEDFNAHILKEAHEKVLKPHIESGDIKIVTEQWADGWSPEVALKHIENGLTVANNDVVAVLASNDAIAGGAVQALEAQGLAGKVGVSGQDAALEGVQRIVEGKQTSTVYKPLIELNEKAMRLAHAIAKNDNEVIEELINGKMNNGTLDVPSVLVDVIIVTKDNMMETIVADGFHKKEDVYRNVPKDQWPD